MTTLLSMSSYGAQSTIDNALTELSEFGIARVQTVAQAVDQWSAHFTQPGVCAADMELLAASVDRDALRLQRRVFC